MKATTAEQRKEKLKKLKSAVEAHADEIVAAVKQDTRKPEGEIKVTEILGVIGNIQRNIDNLDEWMKPVEVVPSQNKNDKAQDRLRGARRVPHPGAVEFSARVDHGAARGSHRRGQLLHGQAHRPVPGDGRQSPRKSSSRHSRKRKSPCLKAVSTWRPRCSSCRSATSSSPAARESESWSWRRRRRHLATVTLELGGKSPVIVDDGADVKKVAADLAAAKQFNGGQACISPDYVFVKEAQKGALIEEFRAKVKQNLYRDDGSIKKENIAQIVNDQNFARIKKLFDDAIAKGAKVAVGGTLEQGDRTIHPTLLTDVTPDMQIMQEEIFAPIVPVVTYKNIDEVIRAHLGPWQAVGALHLQQQSRQHRQGARANFIGRRDDQRVLLSLPGEPVAVRWCQSKRHGQLSRRLWVQGVLA